MASLIAAPGSAFAMSASELFADGNRLFRDDLYWAALLRYRQAAEAGLDTPLLAYNTGVAHYRAGQHIRAREALIEASASPSLRVLSHYNLGLNAWAAGRTDEALDWLRRARDQDEQPKIAGLARRAIASIRSLEPAVDPVIRRAEESRREKKPLGSLDLRATLGFGNDDNVFRSPDRSYVDRSDPAAPTVTPEVQSGAFMPLDLSARYQINTFPFESFFGQYRVSGRYYQDKELDGASEYAHELAFGSDYRSVKGERKREVYSAFRIAQHVETYYDPDDGTPRDVDGVAVDDRLNYLRYGPDLRFRQSFGRLTIGGIVTGQLWNYENPEVLPEYDHEYFRFGLHTQYRFTRTSLLRVTAQKSSRRYGDWPSYDLDGVQRIGNPTVRYDYLDFGLLARQRITSSMWFGFGYKRRDREDRYAGYNDYARNHYEFEFHWSPSSRLDLELETWYRNYNFANAYAFNEPDAGRRTLETLEARAVVEYRMTPSLALVFEGVRYETASTDTRIQYERNLISLGVRWVR